MRPEWSLVWAIGRHDDRARCRHRRGRAPYTSNVAAQERSQDRPADRGARNNGRNGHRDDAVVVPARRPTAPVRGDGRPAARAARTELESRGRPAGPVRFPELSEWAASRQAELDRDVEAAPDPAATETDSRLVDIPPPPPHGPVGALVPVSSATVALADGGPVTDLVPRVGPLSVRSLIEDRGPVTAPLPVGPPPVPIPVGPPTTPIALPVAPVPAPGPATTASPEPAPRPHVQIVSTRRSILRRRPRVRRVSRVVRRVDAWSVLKVSLILYALAYLILLVAGILLWKVAIETGTLANVEGFVRELFGLTTFELHGKDLYRASWTIGAFLVVAGTGLNVTVAVMFNLITDLVGGVRVTVLEEEVRLVERGPNRRARRAAAAAFAAEEAEQSSPAPGAG